MSWFWLEQVWILKGRNDEMYRGMWVRAMDEMLERLTGYAETDQLQYIGDIQGWVSSAMAANQPLICGARLSNL